MIAHQVQEGVAAGELARAINGVPISQRLRLRDEPHASGAFAGRLRVARLIARPDHHADLLHLGRQGLLDQNPEDRFLLAVPVDQGLQRKRPLVLAGCRDHRFLDSQVWCSSKECNRLRVDGRSREAIEPGG